VKMPEQNIPQKKEERQEGVSAPFNMAIATLMRIDQILKDIKETERKTSVNPNIKERIPRGYAQHQKYRLTKQLYLQSIPLLKKNQKEQIKKKFSEIKLKYVTIKPCISPEYTAESYVPEIDDQLDEIIALVQESLQEQRYFMPLSEDPSFALLGR